MSDGAQFGRIECVLRLGSAGNHKRHGGTPVVRTTFPQITGVDRGRVHIIDADESIRNCDAATMLALSLNYQHQVEE
jgi:hypothetical protein